MAGRAINEGKVDNYLTGEFGAMVFVFDILPPNFAECASSCSEDLQATISRSGITVQPFDAETRTLHLSGEATARDYLEIFQTLLYTNRASSSNLEAFEFKAYDGDFRAELLVNVTVNTLKKRSVREADIIQDSLAIPDDLESEKKDDIHVTNRRKRIPYDPISFDQPNHVKDDEKSVSPSVMPYVVVVVIVSTLVVAISIALLLRKKTVKPVVVYP